MRLLRLSTLLLVASLVLPVPAAEESGASFHGGFVFKSDQGPYELGVGLKIQPRWHYASIDGGDDETSFLIRRMEVGLKGKAFSDALRFKFVADFAKGTVALKDAYLEYALTGQARVRAGQFKRPFSRQQLTSDGRLELVDRAITDAGFGAGRDIGLMLHNGFSRSPTFEYAAGVFNGTGNVPDRLHPMIVVRAGYNHGGIKGYSEADLEGGALRFGVGFNVAADFDADDDDDGLVRLGLDYILKLHGFSASGGLYYATAQSGPGFGAQAFSSMGLHAQLAYVIAGRYQPTVRYAVLTPTGPRNETYEILGGLTLFLFGHSVKWATDAGAIVRDDPVGTSTSLVVRTQLQLAI